MVLCTRSVGRGADWHGDGRELRAIAPGFGRGMLFVGSTGKGREYTSYRGRRVRSFADNVDDDNDDDDDDATSLPAWLMSAAAAPDAAMGGCLPPNSDAKPGMTRKDPSTFFMGHPLPTPPITGDGVSIEMKAGWPRLLNDV